MILYVNDEPVKGIVWDELPTENLYVAATLAHGCSHARTASNTFSFPLTVHSSPVQ